MTLQVAVFGISLMKLVACDSWIVPIHGSVHILVDPVTRGCGEKLTNRVKSLWVGTRGQGASENDEINA